MRQVLFFAGLLVTCASAATPAQWLNYKTPGVPRTADGKPRLDAPAPRAADGRPDLSGVWMHETTTVEEFKRLFGPLIDEAIKVDVPGMQIGTQHKYGLDILLDFKPEGSPMRPEAAAGFLKGRSDPPPEALCDRGGLPFGFPLAGLLSEPSCRRHGSPWCCTSSGNHRQIYTDGRQLPAEYHLPAYFGSSVGRWERDTFVVETAGFNDKMRLDALGHAHSDQLRVVERFRRRDFGHLDVEMTFDDPKTYTRPFTVRIPHNLMADDDIFEMFPENEKDCDRIAQK